MADDKIAIEIELRKIRETLSGLSSTATGIRGVGDAGDRAGRAADRSRRTWIGFGSSIDRVAFAAKGAGLAFGAMAGMAAFSGVKFNASMEQNTVAFANFLGSQKRARKELEWLGTFAAKSPFEFNDVVSADRKLLAFGMSAKKARSVLTSVGEASAGLGLAGPEIDRMVMALGQIQAKGKLSTEELLQMAELGVPAFAILKKEMGLTGAELEKKLRDGAISADQGIAVLLRGMDSRFKGSMAGQASTFNGQLSTLKDNFVMSMGAMTGSVFDGLRTKALPMLNGFLGTVSERLKKGGSLLNALGTASVRTFGKDFGIFKIAPMLDKVVPKMKAAGKAIIDGLKPAMPFLENVIVPLGKGIAIGVIGSVVMAGKVVWPILKGFMRLLGWVGQKAKPLKGFFEGLGTVIGFVFAGPILKGIGMLGKLGRVFGWVGNAISGMGAIFGKILGVAGRLIDKVFGGIATRVTIYIGRAVIAVKSFGPKMLNAGKSIGGKLMSGMGKALGASAKFVGNLGRKLFNWVARAINERLPNSLGKGQFSISIPSDPVPLLARGGVMRRGTNSRWITGEAGPELNEFDGNSVRVTPMAKVAAPNFASMLAGAGGAGGDIVIPITVKLPSGRELYRETVRIAKREQAKK